MWDYPRPPKLEPVSERIRIELAGRVIADTTSAFRVLETSHPPVYYIPPDDIVPGALEPAPGASLCEFKGVARYWSVRSGDRLVERAAWSYADPTPAYEALRDHVAFYCAPMDACFVGSEKPGTEWWEPRVRPSERAARCSSFVSCPRTSFSPCRPAPGGRPPDAGRSPSGPRSG